MIWLVKPFLRPLPIWPQKPFLPPPPPPPFPDPPLPPEPPEPPLPLLPAVVSAGGIDGRPMSEKQPGESVMQRPDGACQMICVTRGLFGRAGWACIVQKGPSRDDHGDAERIRRMSSTPTPPSTLALVVVWLRRRAFDADAAARTAQLLSPEVIDGLLADAQRGGLAADGPGGLIQQMIAPVLERALETEMVDHLGYERGQAPAGGVAGNHRNGHTTKTVITTAGPVRVSVPRDRGSSFEPRIVPKRRRRLGQVDEAILSLYARGMTTRNIRDHLAEVYGTEVSHEPVANVTDVVADEVRSWQNRPVDEVYPILYVDAIRIKAP